MFSRHKDGKRYGFIARQKGKGGYGGHCVRPCYWCEGGCSMHRPLDLSNEGASCKLH
jgi:hypothetical protein